MALSFVLLSFPLVVSPVLETETDSSSASSRGLSRELVGVAHPNRMQVLAAPSTASKGSTVEQTESPLCVEKLLDIDGERFIDFFGGIAGFHARGTE
jgi:hypothetical protein